MHFILVSEAAKAFAAAQPAAFLLLQRNDDAGPLSPAVASGSLA